MAKIKGLFLCLLLIWHQSLCILCTKKSGENAKYNGFFPQESSVTTEFDKPQITRTFIIHFSRARYFKKQLSGGKKGRKLNLNNVICAEMQDWVSPEPENMASKSSRSNGTAMAARARALRSLNSEHQQLLGVGSPERRAVFSSSPRRCLYRRAPTINRGKRIQNHLYHPVRKQRFRVMATVFMLAKYFTVLPVDYCLRTYKILFTLQSYVLP